MVGTNSICKGSNTMMYFIFMVVILVYLGLAMARTEEKHSTIEYIILLVAAVFGPMWAYRSINHRIIMNDDGIIVKSKLVPWSEIFRVDGSTSGFIFYYFMGEKHKRYIVTFNNKNYKEYLEYTFKKLPSDIFTEDAQKALKEMGIWG